MLNYTNIIHTIESITNSENWFEIQNKFNRAKNVYLIGHAGNLSIANYAAENIIKLSNRTKYASSPSSAVTTTLHIHDTNFDDWLKIWLENSLINQSKEDSLVIGLSSSGTSINVINALEWANKNGINTACITAKPLIKNLSNCSKVILNVDYYYLAETITSLLLYELINGAGFSIPNIKKPITPREHSFGDEAINLGIDFDGVIHKNSKGFYDGTVYDDPIENVENALKELSTKYKLIIYTAKAKQDRPLINGKTGTQLVWEWLKKHNLNQYITDITAEKPRAVAYIDDKGFRFFDWDSCLDELKNNNII